MTYTSQHCCDKAVEDKMGLYLRTVKNYGE